jgi:O-acetyl-ADP-ribose deacetylase (regulator of RNase III)
MTFEFITEALNTKADFRLSDYKSFTEINNAFEKLIADTPDGSELNIALLPPVNKLVSIPEAFKLIANHKEREVKLNVYVTGQLIIDRLAKYLPNYEDVSSEYQLLGRKIVLKTGNITDPVAQAIVNASNTRLKLGTGISGAIKAQAGPGLQAELDQISARTEMDNGSAVITGAHEMKGVRFIIHAASVEGSEDTIRKSIQNSLKLCCERSISSVAFPALGTGTGSMNMETFSLIFHQELVSFFKSANEYPKDIYLVLLNKPDYDICIKPFINTFEG